MNLNSPKTIRQEARAQLARASLLPKIMLIFCGIIAAICIGITACRALVDLRMESAGGLSNLGVRSMLSTISTLLPFVNTLGLMVLELGLAAVALRIARGQYVSENTLRMGLDRFFPMLRMTLLQVLLYLFIGVAVLNAAVTVFFLTPFSRPILELVAPIAQGGADAGAVMALMESDPGFIDSVLKAIVPMYAIFFLIYAALVVPLTYRLRFAPYILVDDPRAGAFRALMQSFAITRRHCVQIFKLDLSYWWYYGLMALVFALSYGYLLPTPLDGLTEVYVFYGLYLAAQLAVYYFFRPQVEVSSALIYETVRPKPRTEGVVLGNIFQM